MCGQRKGIDIKNFCDKRLSEFYYFCNSFASNYVMHVVSCIRVYIFINVIIFIIFIIFILCI